jgi:hypothetical protein
VVVCLFLGLDFYGDNIAYNTEIVISNIYNIQLMKSIVDEIKIDDTIANYTNSAKEEWSYDTVLLGDFKDQSLEAGNIDNKGVAVEYIRFKKRRKSTLEWMNVADINYNRLEQLYSYVDRFVQSTEEYEYAIVPLTSNIEGEESTIEVYCEYDGLWLVDRSQGVKFFYNLEYSEIENVTKVGLFEPLQSKYPYTQTNATDYHSGSVSATIISDSTLSGDTNGRQINIRQERLLRESIFAFLKNRKPKILKDGNGRYYLVMILGSPRELPNEDVAGAIANIEFEWIEIGDANNSIDMKNANLL